MRVGADWPRSSAADSETLAAVAAAALGARMFLRFGGKRPALTFHAHRALHSLGVYRRYLRVEWARVERIVVVCSGNICRSPYAEFKLRQLGVAVVSCGTSAIDAATANSDADRVARERGVDLSAHFSKPATAIEYSDRDLILVLEPQHLACFTGAVAAARSQLSLLGLWCRDPAPFIPDPFGKHDACFRFAFDLIDDAVQHIGSRLALRPSATGVGAALSGLPSSQHI